MIFKVVVIFLSSLVATSTTFATDIKFITHDIEGFFYVDQHGELRGTKHSGRRAFHIELVREMRIKMGQSDRRYEVLPFKRALNLIVENEKPLALFNTGRKPYREGKMKWVGPLTDDTVSAYELKNTPAKAKTLDEAKELRVCAGIGGNQYHFLVQNGFKRIVSHTSESMCFKMLALQRVDLVFAAELDLIGSFRNVNLTPNLVQKLPFTVYEVEGFIAFTNNIPDDVISQWQSVLDQLKASGRYDELKREYLYSQ